VHQRASLNLVNGVVFAGFGGHCDQYNYTGWIVGMSTQGKYLTGYSTSAGPTAAPQDGTWNGGGGGCGVWMSGMPIVSDNSGRIFFSTGNAYKVSNNGLLPASGHLHLDTLSEAFVNLAVNKTTGALTQQDYFETYQYQAMDAADRDLGSGGVMLPDPGTFSGGGVARLIVGCGKNGNCYITNADNLGGYKLGSAGGDAIIQTITPPSGSPVFGNPGSYPLEGGYLYMTPVGSPTYVYALGFDSSGRPAFTLVAQTGDIVTGRAGVGPPTITSYKGQQGTAILWSLDPDAGVRAYNAVPVNGQMTRIPLNSASSVAKYQRVVFGDGRYYLITTAGTVVGYGSPVKSPLTCNDPLNFGSIAIGSTKTLNLTCTANIPITSINITAPYMSTYQVSNSSLPQGSLSTGAIFSFPITFNLTAAVAPGVQSTSITLRTANGVTGFSTQQPISVTGKSVSANPYASLIPLQVDFAPLVIGSAAAETGSASTFVIQDIGQSDLVILGYAFTDNIIPTVANTNVTVGGSANGNSVLDKNGVFTSNDLPAVGSVIRNGTSVTVNVLFNASAIGNYFSLLQIYTNGGMVYTTLVASADSSPIALLQQSTSEGGWITIPDCVVPADGCTNQVDLGTSVGIGQLSVTISFTNEGGSDLEITKSKPLEGSVLGAENPNTDLSEGLFISPGDTATAAILFSPGVSVLNADPIVYSGAWTLNTNDLTFGVHTLNFTATLAAPQVGPLISGKSQFQYLGCFQDSVASRIEPTQYNNVNNTNGLCQQQALAAGMPFAGTEYNTECYVGSNIPSLSLKVADSLCSTYFCPGDRTQICGGIGGYIYLFYDTTKYFPQNGTLAISAPSSLPTVGPYKYLGCFTDNTGSRALSGKIPGATSTNTLESCAAACSGYNYFGTEYGTECYCGNSLGSSATAAISTTWYVLFYPCFWGFS
jgi:WSC domain